MSPVYGKMNSQSVFGRLFLLCTFGAMTCQSASAGLVQEPWDVICVVSNASTQSSRTFIRNENPFQNSHTATLGNSSCSAAYDFSWTGDEASFGVTVNHHLEQLQGETISSGRIFIRPAVDSVISISAAWQYAWPGQALGSTHLSARVGDSENGDLMAEVIAHGGNVGLGPPHGTFDLTDDGILQAGRLYGLFYTVRVLHIDPTPPGTYGTGAGHLNFTITPVPEPAALAMWVLPILLIRHRGRGLTRPMWAS